MKLEMKYFVLKPAGITDAAEASREAMKTYARFMWEADREFAKEILAWVVAEEFIADDIKRSLKSMREGGDKHE